MYKTCTMDWKSSTYSSTCTKNCTNAGTYKDVSEATNSRRNHTEKTLFSRKKMDE